MENLITLLNKGFYKKNLSELLTVCEELLQSAENTLVIFTLKGLFQDMYSFYDNAPVIVVREQVLTAGLKVTIIEILNNINTADWSSLEELISLYESNKAKLKSFHKK